MAALSPPHLAPVYLRARNEDPMRPQASLIRSACTLVALAATAAAPLSGADALQEVGKTAGEWVKTRAETARLETDWVQDRTLLTSTINGLKERAARLEEKRDHLLAATAAEREEQAALTAKLNEAKASLQSTETRLQALTEKVLKLRPHLPPRLSEALEMSYRSLATKETSPGEHMQLVMTVLNRCAQFNLSISHGEEVLALPGEGSPKAVDVIYWGLSHGYALDRAAGKAWFGAPAAEGWRWEAIDAATPAVTKLLAIRRDEADPELVLVPARLKLSGQ